MNPALRPAFEVEYVSSAFGLITSGLGVAVLPQSMVDQVNQGRVVYRQITAPEIHRDICAITLKSHSLAPAAEASIRTCVEHQAKLRATAAGRDPANGPSGRKPRAGLP